MLNFDKFCQDQDFALKELLSFIEYDGEVSKLKSLIKVPSSIGRYKNHPLDVFNKEDIECVESVFAI